MALHPYRVAGCGRAKAVGTLSHCTRTNAPGKGMAVLRMLYGATYRWATVTKMLRLASVRRSPMLALGLLLAGAKSMQFAIDSTTLFFIDSGSFLLNGLQLAFIPERSYVYGYLLRILAIPFHSLRAIVAMQLVMGSLTSWVLGVVLVRYL